MAKQARIVDFEEVRSSRRSRTSSGGARSSRATSGRQSGKSARGSNARASSRASKSMKDSTRSSRRMSSRASERAANTSSRTASRSSRKPSKGASNRNSQRAADKAISKVDQVKRALAKKRADLTFGRQTPSSASTEDGPRAAVYKTKMGAAHKRANRMQGGEKPAGFSFGGVNIGRKGSIALLVCVCLVLGCAMLYVPVKNYYTAVRDRAKAEVALEIVATRNEALIEDVALLSTEAGMEDRVREQYGWVKQGENAVMVTGLDDGTDVSAADVLRTVTLNDVRAPETWYSPLLDSVFGYEP